ncbi:unnamed protein product [Symbiodinium natans]|uniref:Uncharacterized protein n=1 Tax=Symbiodinium natans TaxID=878477 RepID=A0A812JJ96_9DINO|nr:unnamed protein product [Symbiodinium natans]
MAMALRSLALAWLLDAALGGSGCNEQVKDLGPWIGSVDVEKTEEGYRVLLELLGGDVAASSTESVELLVGREVGQTKHFVLPKAGARKGGVLELRTDEELLGGVGDSFFMQATLAEYNGNNHGPESLSCRAGVLRHSTCRRTEKDVASPPSSLGTPGTTGPRPDHQPGQGGHMMRGAGAGMHEGGQHMRSATHNMPHQGVPHQGMPHQEGMRHQEASQQAMVQQPPEALDECHPSSNPCKGGSACQVSRQGNYLCVKAEPQTSLRSFADPSTGHGFRMLVAGALFVCLSCLCGALFLHRFVAPRGARNMESMPKVMGKVVDGNLSTVQTMTRSRAFENDSDSDDGLRVW